MILLRKDKVMNYPTTICNAQQSVNSNILNVNSLKGVIKIIRVTSCKWKMILVYIFLLNIMKKIYVGKSILIKM